MRTAELCIYEFPLSYTQSFDPHTSASNKIVKYRRSLTGQLLSLLCLYHNSYTYVDSGRTRHTYNFTSITITLTATAPLAQYCSSQHLRELLSHSFISVERSIMLEVGRLGGMAVFVVLDIQYRGKMATQRTYRCDKVICTSLNLHR